MGDELASEADTRELGSRWGGGGRRREGGGLKAATPTPASPGPLPPSGGRLRREGGSRGVPAGAPHGATAPMPAVVLGAI